VLTEESSMSAPVMDVLGTVHADGTLELDQKLSVPPGRVRVRVEPMETPAQPAESLVKYVDRTRRELEAAGHHFMTDEEVTGWIAKLRDEEHRSCGKVFVFQNCFTVSE
jgi:hypothetical protein